MARKTLHDKGFVETDRVGRGARYTLTSKGEKAVTATLHLTATDTARSHADHYMQAGASLEAPHSAVVTAGSESRAEGTLCIAPDCKNPVGRFGIECGTCKYGVVEKTLGPGGGVTAK